MAKTPEQKVAEAEERLARAKAQARKADTRKKVLLGAYLMKKHTENEIREAMNEHLTRDADRKLFGLEPLQKPAPEPQQEQEPHRNIDPFGGI